MRRTCRDTFFELFKKGAGMEIGEVLGERYRIIRRIGSGGEGSVYLALHIKTEQFGAVKEIRGDYPEHCHELR